MFMLRSFLGNPLTPRDIVAMVVMGAIIISLVWLATRSWPSR
jgi:hypothetical protein